MMSVMGMLRHLTVSNVDHALSGYIFRGIADRGERELAVLTEARFGVLLRRINLGNGL